MALSRAAYRNFSATQINNRISNTCTHSVNGSNVDCTDVTVSKVRTVLSASPYNLSSLATHANVNHWSAWGPTVRTVVGGVLTNGHLTNATGYSLGSFGGYNHSAPTPAFTSGGSNTYSLIQSGADQVFSCVLDIGEVLYNDVTGVANQATHIHFSVWDGASWVSGASEVIAIADAVDGAGNSNSVIDFSQAGTRITITGITVTNTYTCKIWFCDDGTFDYTGANKVFTMVEFPEWTLQVRIKSGNSWYVNGPENGTNTATDAAAAADGTFTSGKWDVSAAALNLTNGTITMTYLKLNTLLSGGYNHLHLTFIVESGYFDESSVWQGTVESTSSQYNDGSFTDTAGNWNQNTSQAVEIASAFDIWTPGTAMDSSGYGYMIKINCDTTTI